MLVPFNQSHLKNETFSVFEKILLITILITGIIAYSFSWVLNLLEVSVIIFTLASPILWSVFLQNLDIFLGLSFSLLIGSLTGIGGVAEPTTIFAFLKFSMYLLFIAIIGFQCKHTENRMFFLKWIIIPLAIIMCSSAIVETFVETTFFSKFHLQYGFDRIHLDEYTQLYSSQVYHVMDTRNANAGFAPRVWHLSPWAICGTIGVLILLRDHAMSRHIALLLVILYIFAIILLPQRAVIVHLVVGLASYVAGINNKNRYLSVFMVFLLFVLALVLLQPLISSVIGEQETAFSKILRLGIQDSTGSFDSRLMIFENDMGWLFEHPLYLIFGTGWNITAVPSTRPHNMYVAMFAASGVTGFLFFLTFIKRQLKLQLGIDKVSWRDLGNISQAGFAILIVAGIFDNYLTGRLSVPAVFTSLWLALSIIAAKQDSYS